MGELSNPVVVLLLHMKKRGKLTEARFQDKPEKPMSFCQEEQVVPG